MAGFQVSPEGKIYSVNTLKDLCRTGPRFRVTPTAILPIDRGKFTVDGAVNCTDDGCKSFTLSVVNKTDGPISIDWARTQFIDDGQTRGLFMFEGVRYIDKNQSQAPAIVLPNGSYRQVLFPSILVANPTAETAWEHNSFAAGQKGIAVSLEVEGAPAFETILFDLSLNDAQAPPPGS